MCSQSLCGYGMKRFIILACLVAAQFAQGADVKTIRKKLDGTPVSLRLRKPAGELNSCIVTTNKGENITLYQKGTSNQELNNITFEYSGFYNNYVKIKKPTADVNGKWSVKQMILRNRGQFQESVLTEFHVQIKDILEQKRLIPTNSLDVYEGNYAIFKIPDLFPNLESCILTDSNEKEYNISSEEYSYLKIQEPGVCGVRMPVNKTYTGEWYLLADVRNNETYYGRFIITIKDQNDFNSTPRVLYLQLGEEGAIRFTKNSMFITYCQLEDPNGKRLPVQAKACSYTTPFVTKLHEGIWKAHYGVQGSNTPLKENITVVTFDDHSLNCTVTLAQDKYINLLCRVRGIGLEYCRFTRPDNMSFSVSPGVGNDRYEYYGAGFRQEILSFGEIHDCGVTIRTPSKEDFGAWKCMIKLDNGIIGTILRTDNLTKLFSNQAIRTYGSKIYVPKGNSFTLKCSAEIALKYCWMQSPSGTVHSVSKKGSSPSDLTYEGSGLEFGECGAIVEVADNTHLGEWRCHMGIVNGPEVEANVSVTVTSSLLMADESTIDISYRKPTVLSCRILPGYENVISYCRWIRPDGQGIYNYADNQYKTEKTLSSCKLVIQELNVKLDIGSWSCIAGIAGRDMMEAATQIQIKYSYMGLGGFVSVALTIAFLVITTITLFVIIVRKRRNRYPDEKMLSTK